MSEFLLDESTHIYTLDGRRIVGATEALEILDDRRKDPWYLERGRLIHLATELYDRDELESVDPLIEGYIDGYVKFKKETKFEPTHIEHPIYHPKYFYAMRVDRIGPLNGDLITLDLKSGAKADVDELQGAAYFEGCRANDIQVKKAFDLYLHENGTYKLEPIKNPRLLLSVFLACITITRWKEGL